MNGIRNWEITEVGSRNAEVGKKVRVGRCGFQLTKLLKKYNLVIKKEQVEGMWERLAAAISNAAVSSRFR